MNVVVANICKETHALDWIPSTSNKKGLGQQSKLLTMMSTYIIAMMDSNSILRIADAGDRSHFGL
jgi:hypothetical protein